jgi:hypothetical protein
MQKRDKRDKIRAWGQGDQARGILVDACGAGQNLQNEQNFFYGLMVI